MRKPPPLPIEVLDRVMRVARMDGMLVFLFAGGYAALAAVSKHGLGLAIGVVVTAAGAMELHGVELLKHGVSRGMRWLVASQLYMIFVVVGYATWRLVHPDLALLRAAMSEENRQMLVELGMGEEEFLLFMNRLMYSLFMVVAVGYQGWMAMFYWRRRKAVAQALEIEGEP